MNTVAVIAARGGPTTKSRLAGRLDHGQRERLVALMLTDMLTVLARCPGIRRTFVTTPTPALAQLAADAGAAVFLEQQAGGLNLAFESARRRIAAADPQASLMLLPGDLPRLQPADIETCLTAARADRLILAPADADGGTGGLVLRANADLSLAFGPESFGKHLAAGRAAGLEARIVYGSSLGLDLDGPADLDAFLAVGDGAAAALLRGWSMAA
jgi:2-phospho-L-lactate/phosphoenolpyruvate guanylyltransferase